jgi:putative hydrolase of HD superfamily
MSLRINKQLSFLKEIDKFKKIKRKVYISKPYRPETDAEHVWHLAMFIIIFDHEIPKWANRLKMLKMVMIHDLVEIYAGDTFAHDAKARIDKPAREMKAANKLFKQLPNDLSHEFWKLYTDYDQGKTLEARVVQSFDKLQPIIQNILSKGKAWKKYKITLKDVNNYKRPFMIHNKKINEIYQIVMDEVKKKKITYSELK